MTSKDEYTQSFWEKNIYKSGLQLNRYPYDRVVAFVYRHHPKNKERAEIKIFEAGCGVGNNLWFAAREGFQVTGIDASETAINYAKERFKKENLKGDFVIGSFTKLPFDSSQFDLAIDRGAITCCSFADAQTTVNEIHRCLLKGGKFVFTPFSKNHSSYTSGTANSDGTISNMQRGSLKGIEHICFYDIHDIKTILPPDKWKLISVEDYTFREELAATGSDMHSEFKVIAEKI